jgi:hypothetical protein
VKEKNEEKKVMETCLGEYTFVTVVGTKSSLLNTGVMCVYRISAGDGKQRGKGKKSWGDIFWACIWPMEWAQNLSLQLRMKCNLSS